MMTSRTAAQRLAERVWTRAIFLLAVTVGGCSMNPWERLPPPKLPPGPLTLRVVYAHNPRFERLDSADIATLLSETRRVSQAQFGIDLRFAPVSEVTVPALFKDIPLEVIRQRSPAIFDFKQGSGDRARLRAVTASMIASNPTSIDHLVDFARPHLLRPLAESSRPALAEALSDTMIKRLGLWSAVKASDGQSIISADPYNEWIYWDSLGYGNLAFDLVLTDQPIVSAEYNSSDLHTALRGGLTVGTTTFSRDARFNAYVVWSTFPFTSDSDLAVELRAGRRLDRAEAMRLAGAYLTHEVGHLLFHFGHPFGATACAMNPVAALQFAEWNEKLDPARCAALGRPEMKPGAARLNFNRDWLNAGK